jgi:hypothetical protein
MTTMRIRDVSLFVKVVGRDYPLLLMHGGPSADHTTMLPFRRCADRFTLVFYDHRCNGRSVGAPVSSMTWENLTADAEALRQRLGSTSGPCWATRSAATWPWSTRCAIPTACRTWCRSTPAATATGHSSTRLTCSPVAATAREGGAGPALVQRRVHAQGVLPHLHADRGRILPPPQPVAAGARTPGSCSTRLNAAAAPVGGFEPGRSAQAYCRTVVKP